MTRTIFLRMFEETIMAAPGSLTGNESLEALKDWDSLAVVVFIAQADDHFSISLSGDDILRCRTVNDLSGLLETRVQATHG
jgi:acyl carrier protein